MSFEALIKVLFLEVISISPFREARLLPEIVVLPKLPAIRLESSSKRFSLSNNIFKLSRLKDSGVKPPPSPPTGGGGGAPPGDGGAPAPPPVVAVVPLFVEYNLSKLSKTPV